MFWDNRGNKTPPKLAVIEIGVWSRFLKVIYPSSSISQVETDWVSKALSTSPKSPTVSSGRFLPVLGFS